jgi:hypothetical protein
MNRVGKARNRRGSSSLPTAVRSAVLKPAKASKEVFVARGGRHGGPCPAWLAAWQFNAADYNRIAAETKIIDILQVQAASSGLGGPCQHLRCSAAVS